MNMKKHTQILIVMLLILNISELSSQNTKKQRRKMIQEGQYHIDGEDYPRAWRVYRDLLKLDPANETAAVNSALAAQKLNYPVDSIVFLKSGFQSSKSED